MTLASSFLASFVLAGLLTLQTPNWRSIVPSKTSRTDVENILGHTETEYFAVYKIDEGNLFIEYSSGPCRPDRKGGWNLPKDVVVMVRFYPRIKPRLSDLKLNRKKLRKVVDRHVGGIVYYIDDDSGVVYEIQEGRVDAIEYGPARKYQYLACPDSTSQE